MSRRSCGAHSCAMMVLALAFTGAGCPCVRSAVNASPELRWWLFSNFGASKMCPEMLKRGIPLKLPQLGNASVGRFFPNQCFVQVDDTRKAIVMSASGTGYATLPVARRVGFYVGMTVEYVPDFRLESDATYVWGQFSRFVSPPDLRIVGVENPVVNLATRTPAGDVATALGNGLVASEIGRGFTVVRQDDGDDFTLGHLEPPQKPPRQFKGGAGSRRARERPHEVSHAITRLPRPVRGPRQGRGALLPREGRRRSARLRRRRALRRRGVAARLRGRAAASPHRRARSSRRARSASARRTSASRSRRARTTSWSRTRRPRRSRRSASRFRSPSRSATSATASSWATRDHAEPITPRATRRSCRSFSPGVLRRGRSFAGGDHPARSHLVRLR